MGIIILTAPRLRPNATTVADLVHGCCFKARHSNVKIDLDFVRCQTIVGFCPCHQRLGGLDINCCILESGTGETRSCTHKTRPDVRFNPKSARMALPQQNDAIGVIRNAIVTPAIVQPMCGRFTNRLTWRDIVELYRLTAPASPERNLPARYNICPTKRLTRSSSATGNANWCRCVGGLCLSWWKKTAKETPSTFNARAETVADKPMFRAAFKRTRCLIPASGYYEWENTPKGKQPWYYTARDGTAAYDRRSLG